jgi:hypothetical protein
LITGIWRFVKREQRNPEVIAYHYNVSLRDADLLTCSDKLTFTTQKTQISLIVLLTQR